MKHVTVRIVVAIALIGTGWALARAQTTEPDFELVVYAPVGQTTVQCVRGCEMAWIERGVNSEARPMPTFSFGCTNPAGRCSSYKIGGWIKR